MKKLTSLIFDFLLALMLFRGLTDPQSAAVNFVAVWALFDCLVCIAASFAGVAAYDHWHRNRQKGIPLNDSVMKIFRMVFVVSTPRCAASGRCCFLLAFLPAWSARDGCLLRCCI